MNYWSSRLTRGSCLLRGKDILMAVYVHNSHHVHVHANANTIMPHTNTNWKKIVQWRKIKKIGFEENIGFLVQGYQSQALSLPPELMSFTPITLHRAKVQ